MREKVISNGFIRTYSGPWNNLEEVEQIKVVSHTPTDLRTGKDLDDVFYIIAFQKNSSDWSYISSAFFSQNEAQAALDLIMLQ